MLFPDEIRDRVIPGRLVGHIDRQGYQYSRYQFEIPTITRGPLELVVPPPDVTSGVSVAVATKEPGIAPARLLIEGKGVFHNPQNRTADEYLAEFYPQAEQGEEDEPLLLIGLHARQSNLTYYTKDHDKYPWRSQSAFLNWETLEP